MEKVGKAIAVVLVVVTFLFVGSSVLKSTGTIDRDLTDVVVDITNGDESTPEPAE